MKSILKKDRILVFVALLGLLASLAPLAARTKAEQSNRYYDYILDYSSLRYMASQSTRSEGEWLDRFASLGIDKATVAEATALGLNGSAGIPIHAMTVKDAMGDFGWESSYPDEVIGWMRESKDVGDAIICTDTAEAFDWVMDAFNARVENFTAKTCRDGEKGFIFLSQQPDGLKGEKLLNLRLGIWPDIASLLEEHGYQIVPRTETMKDMNGTRFAQAYIEVLEHYASPYFMNNGDELIGYESDEGRELLAQYLRESGASLAMVEQNDQSQNITWPGTVELLNSIDYHGIRVFNEWGYIQNRYAYCGYTGPEEITNSFFRAIVERNCKVIWLKMILEPDNDVSWDADQTEWTYITDPAAYEKMILDLDARLEPMGYTRTTVPPMELETPSALLRIVQGIGTAALLVLLFDLFFLQPPHEPAPAGAGRAWHDGPCGAQACVLPAAAVDGGRHCDAVHRGGRPLPRDAGKAPAGAAPGAWTAAGRCRGYGAGCHRDGALRLAACLRRALAALLHSGDRPLPRREAHAAHSHRIVCAGLSAGLRL